jgi:MFS-type transporter involved in bile tolerance (Atg22 family)
MYFFVCFTSNTVVNENEIVRGDQEGLFKLVTLDRILNRITGVTSGCWWLVVVNAIPILDICQINQQNISSCSVINNRIKNFSQLYYQLKQSFLITRYLFVYLQIKYRLPSTDLCIFISKFVHSAGPPFASRASLPPFCIKHTT